jgi:hypothetical protein
MTLSASTPQVPGNAGSVLPTLAAFQSANLATIAKVLQFPQVSNIATTSTNDTGKIIGLTEQGFTFQASQLYRVRWRHWAETDNDRYYQELEQHVLGGTTPVLMAGGVVPTYAYGVINGTVVRYGRTRLSASYAVNTATVNTTHTSSGHSIGDTTSGVATITHPIARSAKCISINCSTDVSLNTEHRYGAVSPGVSSTTMELSMMAEGITTATGVVASFADVGFVDAEFEVLPLTYSFLTMNSTAVELHVTGITSDEVKHTVHVFIDEPVDSPFYGS